jgi:hypothetical protein
LLGFLGSAAKRRNTLTKVTEVILSDRSHPERSEGSGRKSAEILRCAQNDRRMN